MRRAAEILLPTLAIGGFPLLAWQAWPPLGVVAAVYFWGGAARALLRRIRAPVRDA